VHVVLNQRAAERPSVTATVPAGGWGTSGQVRYRVASVDRVTERLDKYGLPVKLPAGSVLWRSHVDVVVPAGVKAPGCVTRLVDREGRRFDDGPRGTSALKATPCPLDVDDGPGTGTGTSAGAPPAGSSAPPSRSAAPPTPPPPSTERAVQVSLLYLLPDGARPTQLWIASTDQVPHYLALTVPSTAS